VMQGLIYRASRLIEHYRRLILGLGANDKAAKAFSCRYGELFAASAWRQAQASDLIEATDRAARLTIPSLGWGSTTQR